MMRQVDYDVASSLVITPLAYDREKDRDAMPCPRQDIRQDPRFQNQTHTGTLIRLVVVACIVGFNLEHSRRIDIIWEGRKEAGRY
jgi:hypothetical protein